MAIKKVVVHGGQANFTDLSIQPTFSAGIQALEGTIVGLFMEDRRAKVNLHGELPVSIVGDGICSVRSSTRTWRWTPQHGTYTVQSLFASS
jgi:hypothetical protein